VSMYKDEYIPTNRNLAYDLEAPGTDLEEWYGWEIEQDVNYEFLQIVKEGSSEAVKQAGIVDLMWVAVLDDRTREEHRLKDGLTSSEIEAKLETEWADFDDQETVAPSGFNCRCRSVPFYGDLPDAPEVNYRDFDTWLISEE